jgi:hypothetical protein
MSLEVLYHFAYPAWLVEVSQLQRPTCNHDLATKKAFGDIMLFDMGEMTETGHLMLC